MVNDHQHVTSRGVSDSPIPIEVLFAELARRRDAGERPPCGSGADHGNYNTSMHVGALILILALSIISCAIPLLSHRSNKGRKQNLVVFICQHFGTGVLIATSFVHLLPMAFMSLSDPCLPYAFSEGYKPLAGVVAMASIFLVVGVESYLSSRGAGHTHSHEMLWDDDEEEEKANALLPPPTQPRTGLLPNRSLRAHKPSDLTLGDPESTDGLVAGISPRPGLTPTSPAYGQRSNDIRDRRSHGADDVDRDSDIEFDVDELDPSQASGSVGDSDYVPLTGATSTPKPMGISEPTAPNSEEQKRLFLQCLLLEAGILFHSIFIGMALSVDSGPTFVVFLIAICLHQSFEGLALGSRIAAIHFPKASLRPWLMVLAYGLTTPIGQAIGLVVHNMYDPRSQTGLLLVGFVNAISSGLLLFAGIVQLLAEDFLSEKSYRILKGRRRVHAFLSVLGGAALMCAVRALV